MIENNKNKNLIYTVPDHGKEKPRINKQNAANFEEAITATEFGRFNIFLLLAVIAPCFSQVFESVSISYVLPVAQCDLNLALEDKGILNAVTFTGMISSGFFWGYLCDTLGRKKIIVYGYLLNGFFMIMGSFSPNIIVLMISKFFGGFIINGPYAATTAYLTEFHSSRYRARAQLALGMFMSLANVVLPLMAWGVLPREINQRVIGRFDFHSWNAFLLICASAPILSGVAFIFIPESPKFLMSAGRNQEALEVFKKVYKINTGKRLETYPIECLMEEKSNVKKTTREALHEGLNQIKSLFVPPYILKLLLACFNAFIFMMGLNTLKLWLPQLFQEINDYEYFHNGTSSDMCSMLQNLSPQNGSTGSCVVNLDNTSVYINSIIVGMCRVVAFGVAGLLVNHSGKKPILIIMATISGVVSMSIYFAQNSETVLALSSMDIGFGSVSENVLITITLELFPTTLRTIALSLHMMFGRIGIVVGNVLFPFLLYAGCAPPFMFIGALCIGCACLSFLYPNTENKALE